MDHKVIDELHDFISGRMTKDEKHAFQKELSLNQELQAQYEMLLKEHLLIKEKAKDDLKKKAHTLLRSQSKISTHKRKPVSRLWLSLAASVLILVGFFFTWQQLGDRNHPDKIFAANYERPLPSMTRSNDETAMAWSQAVEAYQTKDFTNALEHLLQIQKKQSDPVDSGQLQLLIGVSQLELQEYKLAKEAFNQIPKESSYFDEGQWLLALVSIKSNNLEQAKQQLRNIYDRGKYKSREAQSILKQLNS